VDYFSNDDFWKHKGKILGAMLGLLIGIIILVFGFFKTLFIVFSAAVGYFTGELFENKMSIRDYLDKILPPGAK
jgi:uncharacterized membrane protein